MILKQMPHNNNYCRWALFQDNAFALVASSEGWDRSEGISDVAGMW